MGLGPSKWEFFSALVVLYILLGTLVDGFSKVFLTLPALYPSVTVMGFDPHLVWC